MSSLAVEVDQVLGRLDPETAQLLEKVVRDAIALAEHSAAKGAVPTDALGYPIGYFEATAGSFANEPLEEPAELPPEQRESW
jgi:hypothetical protein